MLKRINLKSLTMAYQRTIVRVPTDGGQKGAPLHVGQFLKKIHVVFLHKLILRPKNYGPTATDLNK